MTVKSKQLNTAIKLVSIICLSIFSLSINADSNSCQKIKLRLQAIQSNFISPGNPFGGNNGLPVQGLTIPIELSVNIKKQKNKVKLNIESFSFSLPVKAFLFSMTVIPQDLAPASAKWIDFNAGTGIVGHVFRDGSIRISGPNNEPLAPGNYTVTNSTVSYSTKIFPSQVKGFFKFNGRLVACKNFPISKGLTNLANTNSGIDYLEFYGLAFRDKQIYTATTDNSFDNSRIPIWVFNRVDENGKHLIPQINIVPPGFANDSNNMVGAPYLAEGNIAINPTKPNQLATTVILAHHPIFTRYENFFSISNDSGKSWKIIDPLKGINLPNPPGFIPSGGCTGCAPIFADHSCIYDKFGNLFYEGLQLFQSISNPNTFTAFGYVLLSADAGDTWKLIDFIKGVNPKTFGLDYPQISTGPGPDGSSVTWIVLKQDANFDEILGEGATFAQMTAAYKTTGLGQLVDKQYKQIPGSEIGGYGTIAIGPKGDVLVVGIPVNNKLGSLPYSNGSIWFSYNKDGIAGSFSPIKIIANSNSGFLTTFYTPQNARATWIHPNAVIDNRGRFYLVYTDQPTPHLGQPNPNAYLIYSDDKGKHWSTPMQLNNDVTGSSFQFMPQLAIDPISNDLAVGWLDSREDALDISTRLWATVIKNGSLPKFKKNCR